MALIAKKSLTVTAKKDIDKYIGDIDDDLIKLFIAMRSTPVVSKGIVAPTSTPTQVGDIYIDTFAGDVYMATGITSSADWTKVN